LFHFSPFATVLLKQLDARIEGQIIALGPIAPVRSLTNQCPGLRPNTAGNVNRRLLDRYNGIDRGKESRLMVQVRSR
jgi:hypothetical protein